jgi:Uma2 family endonuclease
MSEPMIRTVEPALAKGWLAKPFGEESSGYERLPTMDELPYDDGRPMESDIHCYEITLLGEPLKLHWADRKDFFAGGNMFVYYSLKQIKKNDFLGPDFFVALGVRHLPSRKSWVSWHEGKLPDLVIEFLSETTAANDRKGKKEIYQNEWKVKEYFYFDPFSDEFKGFRLTKKGYQPILPDERGRLVSEVTGLALRRWEGEYQNTQGNWLRWETLDGVLLPLASEQALEVAQRENIRAEKERKRATEARKRANAAEALVEQERAEKERFAAKLRELGIDPDTMI